MLLVGWAEVWLRSDHQMWDMEALADHNKSNLEKTWVQKHEGGSFMKGKKARN